MEKLRELRLKHGITTTELGKAVGCSNPTITNYELGNRKPDPEMLIKLANYFNVTVDYLLGRTSTFTDRDYANGVTNKARIEVNTRQYEWLELGDEVYEVKGEDYYKTLVNMIEAIIKQK